MTRCKSDCVCPLSLVFTTRSVEIPGMQRCQVHEIEIELNYGDVRVVGRHPVEHVRGVVQDKPREDKQANHSCNEVKNGNGVREVQDCSRQESGHSDYEQALDPFE